jgi:aryl-alcohol dehydrogenase-like predicted oxidoreductase
VDQSDNGRRPHARPNSLIVESNRRTRAFPKHLGLSPEKQPLASTLACMRTRELGRTGRQVSIVGLGCWQLGGDWGQVDDADAMGVLHAAVDAGVTFLDTADVYGDGRSELLIGRLLAERPDAALTVATKIGRRADPHVPEAFTLEAFRNWTDRSRANLGVEVLDLVQLHCPPTQVFSDDRVFDALDTLVAEQRIAAYGVSVETCEEALTAIARPHVATVQLILNVFRRKPLERVLPAALQAGVGVIARVPLASGLLSGKYDESTTFAPEDHRTYNRQGEAFDVGETFSGVPFEIGVRAARSVSERAKGVSTAQLALRWILDQPGVSTVIPGARNASQVKGNAAAADLEPLSADVLDALRDIYDGEIREHVHDRW